MAYINKKDTQGTKPLLTEGELGYDKYVAGGDVGRVYVGTGSENIALAKKSEVDAKVDKVASTDNAIVRFDGTTGQVQNSGVIVDDSGNIITLDNDKGILLSPDKSGGASIKYASNGNLEITPRSGFSTVITAGNIGIGGTPSPWNSGYKALQINSGAITSGNSRYCALTNNMHATSSGFGSAYINNGKANCIVQDYVDGSTVFLTAPSGTAGNPITWTIAMTLGSNGNLLVGTTTDNGVDKLQVNGSISQGALPMIYSDLNNLVDKTKTYCVDLNQQNIPLSEYGYLEVIVHQPNTWAMQRFTTMGINTTAGRVFVRCLTAGTTWSNWSEK